MLNRVRVEIGVEEWGGVEVDTFDIFFFLLQNDKIYYTLSASKMSLQVIIIQKSHSSTKNCFLIPRPKFYSKQYLCKKYLQVLSTFIHCWV